MYDDLARPPLSARALTAALVTGRSLWTEVRVLESTPSTNAVVAAAAREGAAEGLVVVADAQTAGRGRLDRSWVSPARAGLTVSVLLRPQVADQSEWGWLPLLAGLAVVTALRGRFGLDSVSLKWPNDVLAEAGLAPAPGKLAGLLAEVVAPGAVVVGLGLNVTTAEAELPPGGTSLALLGVADVDRVTVLRAVLRELALVYDRWHVDPVSVRDAYRAVCSTLEREVAVHRPDGSVVTGIATNVDDSGRLIVDETPYAAGDIVHLR